MFCCRLRSGRHKAVAKTPYDLSTDDEEILRLFKVVCVDDAPAFPNFHDTLNTKGFEPPSHGYVANRWRDRVHVKLNALHEYGFFDCTVTDWSMSFRPSEPYSVECSMGLVDQSGEEASIEYLDKWTDNDWDFVIIELIRDGRCRTLQLLAVEVET